NTVDPHFPAAISATDGGLNGCATRLPTHDGSCEMPATTAILHRPVQRVIVTRLRALV
ncbi:MAG: hypothetical protein K0R61_2223, partial [Microvirga sp.]|nr:hypothetical protein [Microvirga sp.]